MHSASALERILSRDRLLVGAGLLAIGTVAWIYMVREANAMASTGVCRCLGMKMSGPDTRPWSTAELLPLFLMWAEMMVAMMIPSAAPTILTFALVNRKRREREQPFVPTAVFVSGYLAVWTAFSAMAAVLQWMLHGAALLSPMMTATGPYFGGGLLIAGGLFQWTPIKNACLTHCRSPLDFLMTGWREGTWGAFILGVKHGAYCAGCCWLLMALLFVAGVMNIWWVAVITILVLVEKAAPNGPFLAKLSGIFLAAWGMLMMARFGE